MSRIDICSPQDPDGSDCSVLSLEAHVLEKSLLCHFLNLVQPSGLIILGRTSAADVSARQDTQNSAATSVHAHC